MESKRNETFGRVIFGTNVSQRTWSGRQVTNKEATRQGGAPTPLGTPSTLVGPSWLHHLLLPPIYTYVPPKPSAEEKKRYFHRRNLLYP